MSKIERDSEIVVKFKAGMSMNRLAKKYKLKLPTVERIIRRWFNDIARIAIRERRDFVKRHHLSPP